MAKNLLEQFLDYATSKLTGPIGDDIYIKEEPELSGVARYLARQEQTAQAKAAVTGVEKYLAKQAQAVKPVPPAVEADAAPQTAAPLSGVAKYLSRQQGGEAKPATAVAETETEAAVQETAVQEAAAPLSRVARYLANQLAAAVPAVAEAVKKPELAVQEAASPLSRVERYLAEREKASEPAAVESVAEQAPSAQEAAAPLSRVARYLAEQEKTSKPAAEPAPVAVAEASSAPVSRVAKYLAGQEAASKPAAVESKPVTEVKSAEPQESAPVSRVAKYLAAIGKEFKPDAASSAPVESAPAVPAKTGVAKYLASVDSAATHAVPAAAPARVSSVSKYLESEEDDLSVADRAPDNDAVYELEVPAVETGDVIRLDDGLQCQASTLKGTQCKNKANLGHLQRTIDNQTYQFSVCGQHHNEAFKPFAALIGA